MAAELTGIYVTNELFRIWVLIFTGVDDKISKQLLKDKSTIHLNDTKSKAEWTTISNEIDKSVLSSEESLNEVFQMIGTSDIDKKMSPSGRIELLGVEELRSEALREK
jgi:hypothetical protein